jgi:hypothetical protein
MCFIKHADAESPIPVNSVNELKARTVAFMAEHNISESISPRSTVKSL